MLHIVNFIVIISLAYKVCVSTNCNKKNYLGNVPQQCLNIAKSRGISIDKSSFIQIIVEK